MADAANRVVQGRALAAGLTVGTLPMIWVTLVSVAGLNLRPSHVFGAITLSSFAVRLPRGVPMRTWLVAVVLSGLVTLGAAVNVAWFGVGFWPVSELGRLGINLLIGVGIASCIVEVVREPKLMRVFVRSALVGVVLALAFWIRALASSPLGLDGVLGAAGRGDARAILFDAHLPAIRSLHGSDVLLGTRHGAIFGFLVAIAICHAALTHVESHPVDLPDGALPFDFTKTLLSIATLTVSIITVLSLSRSAIVAMSLGGAIWLAVRRRELVWNAWVYVGAAALVAVGVTSLAAGLGERLFQDTESLSTRQTNASEVLEGEWSLFGSPRLPADTDSPHNMIIEFAAAGGVIGIVASMLIVGVVAFGVLTATRRPPVVTLLAVVVLVRLLSAARGTLDTSAVVAFVVFVALATRAADQPSASTSWRSASSAWRIDTAGPHAPLSVS